MISIPSPALDAFLETVPPQVKEAIKNHHVLVGMNHDMVIYAKGRPPRKVREHEGEIEYEEWIYGAPPEDVDFVRFVGDEVVRVETMKVDGQKIVRTEKEVDLGAPTVAKKQEDRPATRPPCGVPEKRCQIRIPPTLPACHRLRRRSRPAAGADPGPNWARSVEPLSD